MIKIVGARLGDALERGRQLRLFEHRAGLHGAEIVAEVGFPGEQLVGVFTVLILLIRHGETLPGVADRRRQQFGPRQLAEAFMRFPQPQHGARHAGGAAAHQAKIFDHFAFLVQIHSFAGGLGRHFAVVEEIGFAVDVQRHKAAAADIAGFRVGDRQGKGGGDRCVDRVAAGPQNLRGDVSAIPIRGGDRTGGEIGGKGGGKGAGQGHAQSYRFQ